MKHSKYNWAQGILPPLLGETENKALDFNCFYKTEICSS